MRKQQSCPQFFCTIDNINKPLTAARRSVSLSERLDLFGCDVAMPASVHAAFVFQLVYIRVYHCHGCDVYNVAYAAFEIGEMYRLVEPHLYRAYYFCVRVERLQQFVGTVGAAQIGEHERVDVEALEPREGVLAVAQVFVEGKVYLHLTVDSEVGALPVQLFNSLVNLQRASGLVGSEVAVAQHCHHRCVVEEPHCHGAELCYVDEHLLVGVAVDERVGNVERALLGVQ